MKTTKTQESIMKVIFLIAALFGLSFGSAYADPTQIDTRAFGKSLSDSHCENCQTVSTAVQTSPKSVQSCINSNYAVGAAISKYTKLVYDNTDYKTASYIQNEIYTQTYNIRQHLRDNIAEGNSDICADDRNKALIVIYRILGMP